MNPSNLGGLPEELYSIGYSKFLFSRPGANQWHIGGDMDSVAFNLNITRKQRYGKDGPVSYLATERTQRIDPSLSAKFMQPTDYIRAAALLGVPLAIKQEAGLFEVEVQLKVGMYYWTGAYGLSEPVVMYTKTGAANGTMSVLDPVYYELSDAALGVIKILRLPNDAAYVDVPAVPGVSAAERYVLGNVGGEVTEEDAEAATDIDIGTQPDVKMEVMIRMVSDIGEKGVLHLYQWNAASDGDIAMVTSNDDFDGMTLKGRVVKTGRGIGRWRKLKV